MLKKINFNNLISIISLFSIKMTPELHDYQQGLIAGIVIIIIIATICLIRGKKTKKIEKTTKTNNES